MNSEKSPPNLLERGRSKDGTVLTSTRRLWMQLQVFTGCKNIAALEKELKAFGNDAVLYADLNDPWGVGVLFMSEDPDFFWTQARDFFQKSSFSKFKFRNELTMSGRTYAVGYENDLDEVLVDRPRGRVLDPALKWAVWYPVMREKAFESLPEEKKHDVMMDHGSIGKSFGKANLAHDIRLACHGVDASDNDFIIGILSEELAAASLVVQAMRKSLQTMHHLEGLGPFFTGRVAFQHKSR